MSVIVQLIDLPGSGKRLCLTDVLKVVENAERNKKTSQANSCQDDDNQSAVVHI